MNAPAPAHQQQYLTSNKPLLWLALGTFAIGTETFMISPLLPRIAEDVSVSVSTAGQLVSVFALAYAISSPVLTAFTGHLNRRRLLIGCLAFFALANLIAWAAKDYRTLMFARVLLASSAGLYVPGANAVAGALVAPERRGRALAIVTGGLTAAIALGVPLGAIVGAATGWRTTFAGVAGLALVATCGLVFGLPKGFGSGLHTATLRERLTVAKEPGVLTGLLVTAIWATGLQTTYTYLAVYVSAFTTIQGAHISSVLFAWGVAAAVGVSYGGRATDRYGAPAVMVPSLVILILAFASLTGIALTLGPTAADVPVLVAVIVWGVSSWAFRSAQQADLILLAGVKVAPVVLSLNASSMYIGFSLGATLGAFTLSRGSAAHLGWVGAVCEIVALLLLLSTRRQPNPQERLASTKPN